MHDIQTLTFTLLPPTTITLPQVQIEAQLVSPDTEAQLLIDLTGENALIFPQVINQLNADEQIELAQMIFPWLLQKRGLV